MTLASLRGWMLRGIHGTGAVDHDHHVGLRQELAGVVAEMHGMIGRQVHVARFRLHHRDREFLRQRGEFADRTPRPVRPPR